MRISRVQVKQLFGKFDFDLAFDPEYVTCITGENGVGKTTILKLIESVLKVDAQAMELIPFESVKIVSPDGKSIEASKKIPKLAEEFEFELVERDIEFEFSNGIKYIHQSENLAELGLAEQSVFYNWLSETYDNHQRLFGNSIFWEIVPGREVTVTDLINEFGVDMPEKIRSIAEDLKSEQIALEPYVSTTLVSVGLKRSSISEGGVPRFDSHDLLRRRFRASVESFERTLSELNSTFAARLIETSQDEPASEAFQKESKLQRMKVNELESQIMKLVDFGFPIDTSIFRNLELFTNGPDYRIAKLRCEDLKVALRDMNQLLRLMSLLKDVLNRKFRNKRYLVNYERLCWFEDEDGNQIYQEHLSSGETNLLTIFHDIAASDPRSSIFLVDEPEVSLNIVWQREFLNDLDKFAEILDAQFIVVTHSPSILQDREDTYVVPL